MIFQDPYESLNPRQRILDIIAEPLIVNRVTRDRRERLRSVYSRYSKKSSLHLQQSLLTVTHTSSVAVRDSA